MKLRNGRREEVRGWVWGGSGLPRRLWMRHLLTPEGDRWPGDSRALAFGRFWGGSITEAGQVNPLARLQGFPSLGPGGMVAG